MCSSKEKITKYTKKEENMAHSQKIKKAQTFELSVKDIKLTVLNMWKELKEIMDKELKEIRIKIYEQRISIRQKLWEETKQTLQLKSNSNWN